MNSACFVKEFPISVLLGALKFTHQTARVTRGTEEEGIGFRGKSRRRRMGGHFLDDHGRGHLAHRWEHSHMTSIVGGRGIKL